MMFLKMENQKIKPRSAKPRFIINYGSNSGVTPYNIIGSPHNKSEYFDYMVESSVFYSNLEQAENSYFDDWCRHVSSISMNFQVEFNPSTDAIDLGMMTNSVYLKRISQEFMEAVKNYKEYQKEFNKAPKISIESARRFLLLLPLLAIHKPKVYIDAQNGCFNFDMQTRDNGILSTQISDNGQIHYSYVAQNKRIYKITGTAKFKDPRDFIKFKKILKML